MDFVEDDKKNKIVKDEQDSDDSENELYALLDAPNMSTHASTRDYAAFESHGNDDGFGVEADESQFDGFRNAASFLSGQHEDVYGDVYRCVTGVELGDQFRMGAIGEARLDQTIVSHDFGFDQQQQVFEPTPRIAGSSDHLEYTHVYVVSPLKEFIKTVNSLLDRKEVDYTFESSGCFYRAMYYPPLPSVAVDFRIYINSCPSIGKNRYVVEWVRRDGDNMVFNQLFAWFRKKLISLKLATKDNGDYLPDDGKMFAPLPFAKNALTLFDCWSSKTNDEFDDLDEEDIPSGPLKLNRGTSNTLVMALDLDEELEDIHISDEDLFIPLVDMAKSEYEDVHSQGVALIAHEASKGNSKRMVKAVPDLIPLLLKRLESSKHREVRRNCCVALHEMANAGLTTELLTCNTVELLTQVAATPYDVAVVETQRQAMYTLSSLSTTPEGVKHILEAVQDKAHIFDRLEQCPDEKLTKSIATVRSALQAH